MSRRRALRAMKPPPRTRPADSLNRREFLAAAGASTAMLGLAAGAAELGGTNSTSPSGAKRRIRLGFLGATHAHADGKLEVVRASPDYTLVGVCEESAEERQRLEKQDVRLLSPAALFEQCEVIAVESAVRDHARHALLALRAGKHVHLEKPPATTLSELQEMVALARENKLLLQAGYMWRYHPGFRAIFEAVRQGWLGGIYLVRGSIHNHLAPARRPEWAEFKGGAFFELGSHLLDAIVRLLGRPENVTPFLRRHGRATDALKDNNLVVLEYDRALAVITNTALQPTTLPQRSLEVLGANGTAVLRPLEPPALEIELATAAGPYRKGTQTVTLPPYHRYEADFAELAAAVRGEGHLTVALEDELLVQETLLKASGML